MRDVMLADDDFDVDAEVVRTAQHFDYAARGVPAIFREFENFDVDDHAVEIFGICDVDGLDANAVRSQGRGRKFHAFGNVDPLIDALVVRNDVGAAFAETKFADDGEMGAAQDFDDFTVGAAIALNARYVDHHAVPMHGGLGGLARDVDIAAQAFDGTVGDEEAVTIAMHIEPADGVLARETRGDEMAGADLHQVASAGQAIEGGIHLFAR